MLHEKEDLEKAFNKELFVIKNDLYYQQIDLTKNGKKELLRVDISYRPHSTLSGDTYSLRKTNDGRLVGFIADAMGKGLSAAMSAMAITRFLNYFFDELEDEEGFVFDVWIKKTLKFLQKNLFDEEIMSIVLIEYDIQESIIKYASCGMPTFFILSEENEFQAIRSNNPPLSIFTENVRTMSLPSIPIAKMLCYSDGLSESSTSDGKLYASYLKEDFIDSICVKDFRDKVSARIGKGDDDLTYVYIQKLARSKEFETLRIASTYEAIDESLTTISQYLKEHDVDSKTLSQIMLTLSELLLNALEHGSFGVDKAHKNYLIEHNLFDDEMARLEKLHQHKKIKITYGILPSGKRQLFEATISDQGEGFDTMVLKNIVINAEKFNGRGFVIIRKLLDHFYFNKKGNAITIQKFITPFLEL
ncbi:response regulator receiver domain protein [Sulfurospirillum diekertiae]|jgi:anti-sigma regulatory factor (Ser/Thr protein kinase)|uniref:Response regulator receiver domain protein n=1 Tax=Sulfurospirillum diekertiae TaxID=1854492 RepID=A0A290HGI0_9BACT|nr:SpoIIE family protein phosphatase [Sulfurospirillum diekertiae]ATB70537.1 response regulator receiver domain protein [Sulfurospirillum diekertiae]